MRLPPILAVPFLIAPAALAQAPCLVPGASQSTPGFVAGLLAVDLDADGRCDLVTSASSVSGIALRFGQADGSLSAPVDIALGEPVFPFAMAAADLDGDLDLDLVLGQDGLLTVLLREPGGGYAPTEIDLGFRIPNGLAQGDVDGDLDPDVVAVDASSDQLLVFANDGAGGLSGPTASSSAVWSTHVALADLEGDQDLDAWMVGIGDGFGPPPSFVLSTNSGAGDFSPAPPVIYDSPVGLAVGDLDGDGDPDLVLVERDSGLVRIHENTDGVLDPPTFVQLPPTQLDVCLADLDQDGDPDVVTTSHEGVLVVWNEGGSFAIAPLIPLSEAVFVAAGDFDGDGALDLAVTRGHPGVDTLTVLRGICQGIGNSYCLGDGSGTPCPCNNTGAPGRGCATSVSTGGFLTPSGSASVSADDLSLNGNGLRPNQSALLFSADNQINGGNGIPFGDGLRCAGGNVVRLGLRLPDVAGNASWGPGLGAQGGWSAGDTKRFQVWFRDPGGPCGSNFNLSQGVEIAFGS